MKDKTAFGLVAIWFICAAIVAYALFAMSSCSLVMAPIPDDFPIIDTDTIEEVPIDTILPLEDTCESYEEITEPLFITFYVNLDMPLFDSTFYFQAYPSAPILTIDPEIFFDTVYYSGVNIAGIKNGTSNASQYNSVTRIWMIDGSGLRHHLVFASMSFSFRGALTYEQFLSEWETHKSVQTLRFSNTGYSCEQIISFLEMLLEGCFETPNTIDLRPVSIGSCVIPAEIIAECELRGSNVLQ